MKYMGSKRQMLQNGLGDIVATEAKTSSRVVDLFCGGGSVSWFAASVVGQRVLANDLQEFACVLARAVVERTDPLPMDRIEREWLRRVLHSRVRLGRWKEAHSLDEGTSTIESWCAEARDMCSRWGTVSHPIWTAYGGHYFSPTQALTLDSMLSMLPDDEEMKTVCLAATIVAASCCAAAPGHTAQPFKANATAGRYLREAWCRDPLEYGRRAVRRIAGLHAKRRGNVVRLNANTLATKLNDGDLAFVDPPYSSVQYSRFYHVLETIARGRCGVVQGTGRYPPRGERPTSLYSRPTSATDEIRDLLRSLAQNGCRVVLTFPIGQCSNGLSGEVVEAEARQCFDVMRHEVHAQFSTLGGNTRNRAARRKTKELILVLR